MTAVVIDKWDNLDNWRGLLKLAAAVNGENYVFNAPVTPHAGGGQAEATQLETGLTPILTAATAFESSDFETLFDSVALPPAIAGSTCTLIYCNAAPLGTANPFAIYPKEADTINGIGAPDYFVGDRQTPAYFLAVHDGQWITNMNDYYGLVTFAEGH